jgi:hypothetical protein
MAAKLPANKNELLISLACSAWFNIRMVAKIVWVMKVINVMWKKGEGNNFHHELVKDCYGKFFVL